MHPIATITAGVPGPAIAAGIELRHVRQAETDHAAAQQPAFREAAAVMRHHDAGDQSADRLRRADPADLRLGAAEHIEHERGEREGDERAFGKHAQTPRRRRSP